MNGTEGSIRPIVLGDQAAHLAVAKHGFRAGLRWFVLAILSDAIDRGDKVVGDVGFGDEGARVDFDGLALNDRRFILTDENDFGVGQSGANQPRSVETVSVGHGDVHQNDVGAELFCFVDALNAVRGFAADVKIGSAGQQSTYATAYKLVIVDD